MKMFLWAATAVLLTSCQPKRTELTGHIGRPDISPDGNSITFVYAEDASNDVREIYSSDIGGSNVRQLTSFAEARIKKGPVWSPDGRKIAFHADIDEGAQVFVIDADGSNLTQLTDLGGYSVDPRWSPEGDQIVFNNLTEGSKVQIWIMNQDGSQVRPLHNPDGQNWYPRVTSNGDIIFTSDLNHEEDYYDIFLMRPDGSNLRQLTSITAINWFPEYSPDETRIVFHSNVDDSQLSDSGDFNLYMMNADGTGLRRLTELPGQELHAKWHPSGHSLIFEWYHERPRGLYTLNVSTGDISKIHLVR